MQRNATAPKFRSHKKKEEDSLKKKEEATTPTILPPGWTSGDGKVMNTPFVHPPVGELCAGSVETVLNGRNKPRRQIGKSEVFRMAATSNYLQTHASYNKAFGSNAGVLPIATLTSHALPQVILKLYSPASKN